MSRSRLGRTDVRTKVCRHAFWIALDDLHEQPLLAELVERPSRDQYEVCSLVHPGFAHMRPTKLRPAMPNTALP